MDRKYTNIFLSKALQNLPKLGFWFENKPSGNPGGNGGKKKIRVQNMKRALF
jgi:hypothetical protein